MKRIQALLATVLLATLPLPTQAAESIKIGMVVPLTGAIADAGRYGLQGAKLAVEEINAEGGVLGRPLELIVEDDQTLNPTTVLDTATVGGSELLVAVMLLFWLTTSCSPPTAPNWAKSMVTFPNPGWPEIVPV